MEMRKSFIPASTPLWSLLFFVLSIHAEIISLDRRIDWSQPGVPGGIPHRVTMYKTIRAETFGNGSIDATSAIQTALDECPDGQVVVLGTGKYKIMSNLKIGSYVTLRGEGPGRTILSFEGSGRSGDPIRKLYRQSGRGRPDRDPTFGFIHVSC
jgi:hypothetical protein